MAPRGAQAHRFETPMPHPIVLYARPAEWPGLRRGSAPKRNYLARWIGDAPARGVDPGIDPNGNPSVRALIEADMQILFGEFWDLPRAFPRAAATVLGLIIGYVLWA